MSWPLSLPRSIATLRRFVAPSEGAATPPFEARRPGRHVAGACCELCGAAAGEAHPHLLETASRTVVCVCQACAVLLEGGASRFRRIPRRAGVLADFRLTDAGWDALGLPVHLAFFVRSSSAGRIVALYPSPAGATESLLPLGAWEDLERDNPALAAMEADIEALLVHRIGAARDHLIAPIDRCYALVGLVRSQRGAILGGGALTARVGEFMADLLAGSEALCPT